MEEGKVLNIFCLFTFIVAEVILNSDKIAPSSHFNLLSCYI